MLPRGSGLYRHFGQEFVLVLKGTMEIVLNNNVYTLRKGDSIYFNSSLSFVPQHREEKAEAIWVVTPPTF